MITIIHFKWDPENWQICECNDVKWVESYPSHDFLETLPSLNSNFVEYKFNVLNTLYKRIWTWKLSHSKNMTQSQELFSATYRVMTTPPGQRRVEDITQSLPQPKKIPLA